MKISLLSASAVLSVLILLSGCEKAEEQDREAAMDESAPKTEEVVTVDVSPPGETEYAGIFEALFCLKIISQPLEK